MALSGAYGWARIFRRRSQAYNCPHSDCTGGRVNFTSAILLFTLVYEFPHSALTRLPGHVLHWPVIFMPKSSLKLPMSQVGHYFCPNKWILFSLASIRGRLQSQHIEGYLGHALWHTRCRCELASRQECDRGTTRRSVDDFRLHGPFEQRLVVSLRDNKPHRSDVCVEDGVLCLTILGQVCKWHHSYTGIIDQDCHTNERSGHTDIGVPHCRICLSLYCTRLRRCEVSLFTIELSVCLLYHLHRFLNVRIKCNVKLQWD